MEIKTCEQYVLDQLEQARAERDWLRGKLEQAQDEAEELRGKLMERGERDASKVEQAIRKEGRRKLYRDGTSLIAKERQKIPVAQMAGPVGAVVRDDGVRFESAGAAALATYGYCGSPNIVRDVRTGCEARGHYWKRADEEDK